MRPFPLYKVHIPCIFHPNRGPAPSVLGRVGSGLLNFGPGGRGPGESKHGLVEHLVSVSGWRFRHWRVWVCTPKAIPKPLEGAQAVEPLAAAETNEFRDSSSCKGCPSSCQKNRAKAKNDPT